MPDKRSGMFVLPQAETSKYVLRIKEWVASRSMERVQVKKEVAKRDSKIFVC